MHHLFTPQGRAALAAALAADPLLAFDFDGTLAPIVSRPEDARVPGPSARRLGLLARRLPVAIVSGRRADDVHARLGFDPRYIIGNHGAEDPGAPVAWGPAFNDLRELLAARAGTLAAAGVDVEDKQHSLALHYRRAADPGAALRLLATLLADLPPGLEIVDGKMVWNVVAAAAPDKADAVATLQQRCGAPRVVFVGDDVNDEPVFARAEPSWLTVKVGNGGPASRARYFVDDAGQVGDMLAAMLEAIGQPTD